MPVHVRNWTVQIRRHDFRSPEKPPCVVSEYKYLGVVLCSCPARGGPRQPTICTLRVLVPLHTASSTFLVYVLPSIAWARNFLPHHPLPSRVWIVRCASGVGSCWVGPLVRPMLVSWLSFLTQNGSLRVAFCHYLAVSLP